MYPQRDIADASYEQTHTMAAMAGLPQDHLYDVRLYFEHDPTTLCGLSQVCRAIHLATPGLMYRHIGYLTAEQHILLQRSLQYRPIFKAHIQSWHNSLNHRNLDSHRLKTALAFPNITSLSFSRFDTPTGWGHDFHKRIQAIRKYIEGRFVEQDFECDFLLDSCAEFAFEGIRIIDLDLNFSSTELICFMMLPNVRVLTATCLNVMRAPVVLDGWTTQRSRIMKFSLWGNVLWSMEPSTLHSILSFCPTLHDLRCQVPMTTRSVSMSLDDLSADVERPVSPREIQVALHPVCQTLEKLLLLSARHSVPYDGSYVNFLGFAKSVEQRLRLFAYCLLDRRALSATNCSGACRTV
jgi:hypothetical protein